MKPCCDRTMEFNEHIMQSVSRRRLIPFLGAGISVDSGIPLANHIKHSLVYSLCNSGGSILESVYANNGDAIEERLPTIMLEALFQITYEVVGEKLYELFSIFRSETPNVYHWFFAEMLINGVCEALFTTNFDTLFEDSLQKGGMRLGVDFDVAYLDEHFSPCSKPTVYKIHGSVHAPQSMIGILDQVGRGLSQPKADTLRSFLHDHDFLFVGWSDNDIDISPLLFDGSGIFFWAEHQPKLMQAHCEKVSLANADTTIDRLIAKHHGWKFIGEPLQIVELLCHGLSFGTSVQQCHKPPSCDSAITAWASDIADAGRTAIMADVLKHMGLWDEAMDLLRRSRPVTDGPMQTVRLLVKLSGLHYDRGDFDEAMQCCRQAEQYVPQCGDESLVASLLSRIGTIYYRRSDWGQARSYHEKCLEIFTRLQNRKGLAKTLGNLGLVNLESGNWDAAVSHYEEALCIFKELGDVVGMAKTHTNIGVVHHYRKEWQLAIQNYSKDLELSAMIGDQYGVAIAYGNIAQIQSNLGWLAEAEVSAKRSLDAYTQLQDVPGIGYAKTALGIVYGKKKEYDKAEECFLSALDTLKGINESFHYASTVKAAGTMYIQKGDGEKASKCLQEALSVFRAIDSKREIEETLAEMAKIDTS